ncbi:uncharacterized protein LOC128253878 [Drosophila gunungcola]|uniref:Protein TsetseEP domain-containing protein n=1 Tax=Drosophila gunungcola TaxID=103775 RepID=A0A9P9YMT6_9MUSC|nr:uncharacterized protein LOC128253878 [Drosophila gunungcola]KAI8039796.1 hypothetical protein M5D96_007220 [Drosophila gunungcola]
MQLFTQVILFAVALISVSAVPHVAQDVGLDQVLFRMALGESEARDLTPAAQTCANNYVNTTQKNAEKLANATDACEQAANRTKVAFSQSSNTTVSQIRLQLLSLEQNLQLCRNETDAALFLNCTVSTFDKNLQLLDTSNSQAYQTQTQFSSNATQMAAQRTNCISSAVSEAKVQSIQTANDFDACVAKIPGQRDLDVPVPQQKEQQQVKPMPAQVPKDQVPAQGAKQEKEDVPLSN